MLPLFGLYSKQSILHETLMKLELSSKVWKYPPRCRYFAPLAGKKKVENICIQNEKWYFSMHFWYYYCLITVLRDFPHLKPIQLWKWFHFSEALIFCTGTLQITKRTSSNSKAFTIIKACLQTFLLLLLLLTAARCNFLLYYLHLV